MMKTTSAGILAAGLLTLGLALLPAGAGESKPASIRSELESDRKPAHQAKGRPVLIRNLRIVPVVGPELARASILVVKGKIKAIGPDLRAPKGTLEIDGSGLVAAPGVIDCHSHMAIEGGVNEMAEKLSPEVRIGDVINHKDLTIYRALAGGVTSAQLLHGSANPIGGQAVVIKLRYGKRANELVFREAPRGIKFALGENPKRRGGFPKTRQGIMATMRRAFRAAKRYRAEWDAYRAARKRGAAVIPPRKDLRLETYAGILSGDIRVNCHCYRADEIIMLMKVADEFGFKIRTFQHVLEGYKIAAELKRHGAMASTFSDWWAYKIEAFDAIPHNAALLTRAGIVTSLNSDSGEVVRHLPLEAAKTMRYGGLSPNQALRLVTLNPAIQLGIDKYVGSLEVGKHADLVLWTGHPLSAFSKPVLTMIDGEIYFDDLDRSRRSRVGPAWTAPPQTKPWSRLSFGERGRFLIEDAKIHPISAPAFVGNLLIEDGRISQVSRGAIELPANATRLSGSGLHVSPGFIDAGTALGLIEIGSAEETHDNSEVGIYQPDLPASEGYNPLSEIIPVTRLGGTTMALVLPSSGVISGQASLLRLRGDVIDESLVQARVGLALNFPASGAGRGPHGAPKAKGPNKKLIALNQYLDRAKAYLAHSKAKPGDRNHDPRFEALGDVLSGKLPVIVHLNDAKAMVECIRWANKRGLRLILRGGREAWKIADYLAKSKVPLILGPVMSSPRGPFEPWDSVYRNPLLLAKAGVRFCIQSDDASNARILPFEAGMAVAHGLAPDKALAAITLAPAQILGIEKRFGSIEKGKAADLIISAGHPLEPSSHLVGMFIDGRPVKLASKQTKLYKRFQKRLKRERAKGLGPSKPAASAKPSTPSSPGVPGEDEPF